MTRAFLALVLFAVFPALAGAQSRTRPQEQPRLPAHLMPPAGKCRIWMDGVPAAQQPAPTDCQTALRQKPANGTVVFGPSTRDEPSNAFRPATPASRDTSGRGNARPTRGRQDTTPERGRPQTTPSRGRPDSSARPAPGSGAGSRAPARPRPDSGRRPDDSPPAPQALERTS
ncbi:MAG: hypothetical protein KF689_03175 [Gemmatimonadaceae bacterium]|nr:hypothetical protein [Gemmatimonadaceae bacterium]MCW5827525.1 hypothetical protein [Gemmatimonadaceae bacterium]